MDYRKINSHIILLAIVIVVGLLVAMVARLMVLGQGVDAGTANLTFVIVLGVCAVVYLIIMSVFSHTIRSNKMQTGNSPNDEKKK